MTATQPALDEIMQEVKDLTQEEPRWTDEELDVLYASAFSFYQQGHFEKASKLFMQLTISSPFNVSYWKGLASSLQMEKKWNPALHAWALTALIEDSDPIPHFHAAECLFSSDQKEEAIKALSQASMRAHANDRSLIEKIDLLRSLCKEETL